MPTATNLASDKDGNLLVYSRGAAMTGGGAYSIGTATGNVAATSSAGAVLFSMWWPGTAGKLALIENIRVAGVVTGTITTSVPFNLSVWMARSFTADYSTNNSTATLTTNNAKRRTSFPTTLMTSVNTLTTVAAGMTGATSTLDAQPLCTVCGATGTVIGTQFFGGPVWLWNATSGQHPITLAALEGVIVTAPLAGPASGTYACSFSVDWTETTDY
jgi:hypothetical protein